MGWGSLQLSRYQYSYTRYTYGLYISSALRRLKEDWRRAARAYREAIALRPYEPVAYFNLGGALQPAYTWRPRSGIEAMGATRGVGGLGKSHGMGLLHADARGVRRGGKPSGGATMGPRRFGEGAEAVPDHVELTGCGLMCVGGLLVRFLERKGKF